MLNKVIVFRGLPRCGKSTISKLLNEKLNNSLSINLDDLRKSLTGVDYVEDEEPYIWKIAFLLMKQCDESDFIIIDECNPSILNIRFFLDYKDIKKKYVVDFSNCCDAETCLSRTDNKALKSAIIRKDNLMKRDTEKIKEYCRTYGITYIPYVGFEELLNKLKS